MLDKKQIWAIFLSEFRMGWKAMEITLIINNAFSPGAAKNVQCSDGSRSFTKETGALKMRSTVASHQKLTDQMRESSKLILLKLYENLPENSTLTLLWSFSIWSKLQRWKSPVNGCLLSWLKIKNIIVLKCHLLLFYATTTNHFSIELWHAKKVDFIQQLAMTRSVVGLRRSSKELPKTKLAPQKGHGHCLVVCWPSDTLLLLLLGCFSHVRLCSIA